MPEHSYLIFHCFCVLAGLGFVGIGNALFSMHRLHMHMHDMMCDEIMVHCVNCCIIICNSTMCNMNCQDLRLTQIDVDAFLRGLIYLFFFLLIYIFGQVTTDNSPVIIDKICKVKWTSSTCPICWEPALANESVAIITAGHSSKCPLSVHSGGCHAACWAVWVKNRQGLPTSCILCGHKQVDVAHCRADELRRSRWW